MGVRTFLESEVTKTTKRKDLLEKMMKLDPNEPTAEEKEHGITKLRYGTLLLVGHGSKCAVCVLLSSSDHC